MRAPLRHQDAASTQRQSTFASADIQLYGANDSQMAISGCFLHYRHRVKLRCNDRLAVVAAQKL
jgi:hypothetical protein